jgi:hypothetical protein
MTEPLNFPSDGPAFDIEVTLSITDADPDLLSVSWNTDCQWSGQCTVQSGTATCVVSHWGFCQSTGTLTFTANSGSDSDSVSIPYTKGSYSRPQLSVLKNGLGTFNPETISTMTASIAVTYEGTEPMRLEYHNSDDPEDVWFTVLDSVTPGSPLTVPLGSALVAHDPILTSGRSYGSFRVVTL